MLSVYSLRYLRNTDNNQKIVKKKCNYFSFPGTILLILSLIKRLAFHSFHFYFLLVGEF